MSTNELLNKLIEQEKNIIGADFLVCPFSCRATIKVAGVILKLETNSDEMGIYRVRDYKRATFIRAADFAETQTFLDSLPLVRIMICHIDRGQYFGFGPKGQVPLRYAEGVQLFDRVVARYDGANCIFQGPDRQDYAIAEAMREGLELGKCPTINGFSLLDKECFNIALANRRDPNEDKMKNYIKRAGGIYKGHKERNNTYTVEFEISGQKFTSVVDKNLRVEAAGICLNGTDRQHDLQSLISVISEGIEEGKIYRVGL